MDYEISRNYLNNENQESYENSFSNNDCFINSNPISNYMNEEVSKMSKSISVKNEKNRNNKIKKHKSYQICNLNDPKLIDAYNEGYYGFNNVPKQYYIYPKFSKKEYNLNKNYLKETKNDYGITNIFNKENEGNIINDNKIEFTNKFHNNLNENNKNINNDEFIYTYSNYPYPRLINISSNLFGSLHQIKPKNENINNHYINNNEIYANKNIQDNYEIQNADYNNEEDDGNFYFINNTITTRNAPFQNIPDDISIDDEELDGQEEN